MGCTISSNTVHPSDESDQRCHKNGTPQLVVELAGVDNREVQLMVERKEIVHYRVVSLRTEIDRYDDIISQLENPKLYHPPTNKENINNNKKNDNNGASRSESEIKT
eukprot:TCONS_00047635-protein